METWVIWLIVAVAIAAVIAGLGVGFKMGAKVQRDNNRDEISDLKRAAFSAMFDFLEKIYEPAAYAAAKETDQHKSPYLYWQKLIRYMYENSAVVEYSSYERVLERIHNKLKEKFPGIQLYIKLGEESWLGIVGRPWVVQLTTDFCPIPGAEFEYWEEVKNWGMGRITQVVDRIHSSATGYQVRRPDGFICEIGTIPVVQDLTQTTPA